MKIEFLKHVAIPTYSTLFGLCETHIAICHENNIKLFEIELENMGNFSQDVLLQGHHRSIGALRFITLSSEKSLVTASTDYVIIWHLNEVRSSFKNAEVVRGHVLCSTVDSPHHISYLKNSSLLCIVFDGYVLVVNAECSQSDKIIATVEGKSLSCAEFLDESTIVTISFNGQVTMINFNKNDIQSRETIQTFNCSLTSLAANTCHQCFAVGSSSSIVYEFAFNKKLKQFKHCMKMDLSESLMRLSEDMKITGDQSSGHVIALAYVPQRPDAPETENEENDGFLLCATERAVYAMNCLNYDLEVKELIDHKNEAVVVRNVTFMDLQSEGKVICAASCMLDPEVIMFSINLQRTSKPLDISMISKVPILPTSLLNTPCKVGKVSKPNNDRPVTFKKQIKSSGYTAAPRLTMFKPKTSHSSKKVNKSKTSAVSSTHAVPDILGPPDWEGIEGGGEKVVLCPGEVNINCVTLNERNQHVACALSNASIHVAKLPLGNFNNKSKVITGHCQSVAGCQWSHDKDILLTYTRNRDVKLWSPPYTNEACLSFQADSNDKIPKDLIHAQFYYLDKFLLLCIGNNLLMFKYALNEGMKDDVKRYLNKSKCKMVGKWVLGTAQNISCMTSPNSFYSYIVLACGSDRTIVVFDLNTCQEVTSLNDAHSRPAHVIRHSTPALSSTSEYFITAAASDGIKLWDLRTQNCVRKFQQHQCATKCPVEFSSCGNFIASATDRRSICIYDVRKTFPLQEMHRKSKVMSLSFSENARKLLIADDSSTVEMIKSG